MSQHHDHDDYPEYRVDRWARHVQQPRRQDDETLMEYRLRIANEMIQQGCDPMSAADMICAGQESEDAQQLRYRLGVYAVEKRRQIQQTRADMTGDLYPEISFPEARRRLANQGLDKLIDEPVPARIAVGEGRYQLWYQDPGVFLKLVGGPKRGVDSGEIYCQVRHHTRPPVQLLGRGTSYPLPEGDHDPTPQHPDRRFFVIPLEKAISFLGDVRAAEGQTLEIPWSPKVRMSHHPLIDPSASLYDPRMWNLYQQQNGATDNQQINHGLLAQHQPGWNFRHFQAGRRHGRLPDRLQKIFEPTRTFPTMITAYREGRSWGLQDGEHPHPEPAHLGPRAG